MAGEESSPNPLNYAAPVEPAAIGQFLRDDYGFCTDLGPMPTEVFISSLLPPALVIAAIGVWLLSVVARGGSWDDWAIVGLYLAMALLGVHRLTRHRSAGRVVGGTADYVYYSGPDTGGRTVTLDRAKLDSIGVRRSWWRPWVFELVAVPTTPGFWTLKSTSQRPVVLMLDLDYDAMSRLAAELRDVPAAAPPRVLSYE